MVEEIFICFNHSRSCEQETYKYWKVIPKICHLLHPQGYFLYYCSEGVSVIFASCFICLKTVLGCHILIFLDCGYHLC